MRNGVKMSFQGRKEQKQVVMKHKAQIYTEACNFAMKMGINSAKNRGNKMRGLKKEISIILIYGGPNKVRGVGKSRKIDKRVGDVYLASESTYVCWS